MVGLGLGFPVRHTAALHESQLIRSDPSSCIPFEWVSLLFQHGLLYLRESKQLHVPRSPRVLHGRKPRCQQTRKTSQIALTNARCLELFPRQQRVRSNTPGLEIIGSKGTTRGVTGHMVVSILMVKSSCTKRSPRTEPGNVGARRSKAKARLGSDVR